LKGKGEKGATKAKPGSKEAPGDSEVTDGTSSDNSEDGVVPNKNGEKRKAGEKDGKKSTADKRQKGRRRWERDELIALYDITNKHIKAPDNSEGLPVILKKSFRDEAAAELAKERKKTDWKFERDEMSIGKRFKVDDQLKVLLEKAKVLKKRIANGENVTDWEKKSAYSLEDPE
jgi:hypothetical protein